MGNSKEQEISEHKKSGYLCLFLAVVLLVWDLYTYYKFGALCHICYFAIPFLSGLGIYNLYKAHKIKQQK